MDSKRLELKVGLFVFIGLVLLGVLLIQFSKGTSVFRGTYTVRLVAPNVGGLKLRASVLLAGVIVGSVSDIQLAQDGKSVTILLSIYKTTKIYPDAQFVIESAGFLGDQFVAIVPTANQGDPLTNNAVINCEPPFDMQQVARSASGFIQRVDDTVKKIEASVTALQDSVLNQQTLTNLTLTVANLRSASAEAVNAVGGIDNLVATNGQQLNLAVSNVVFFSQQLTVLADNANGIIATNGETISTAMTNLQDTTATLKQIADDMHAGKGLAGTILENPQLAANVEATVNNLAITTSNLNQNGLWHILWRHDSAPHTNAPPKAPREVVPGSE
jgi:phospholipid/cholesterol/gamma-HCH transport system substrate-binding protein